MNYRPLPTRIHVPSRHRSRARNAFAMALVLVLSTTTLVANEIEIRLVAADRAAALPYRW